MQFDNLRNLSPKIIFLWIAFTISSLPILVSCSDDREAADPAPRQIDTESFTFFDIGRTTKFSEQIRDELEEKLGRDAIERRSIMDLEINYSGFIKKYFPEIEALNQKLNFPPRERVEHNTLKLMYRYAQKKSVPFKLVELVFSEYTKTPLLFEINFKDDEANIVETLQEKYGQPEVIDWKEGNGKSMFWKKSGDYLIVSIIPDQFGKQDHQIMIYFMNNLKQLVETESKEKEISEEQRAKTGKEAF